MQVNNPGSAAAGYDDVVGCQYPPSAQSSEVEGVAQNALAQSQSRQDIQILDKVFSSKTIKGPLFGDHVSTKGGVTSGVLRYPHLIRYLADIRANQVDVNVLILGPGLQNLGQSQGLLGQISSPQTHEILSAFSEKTKVTVVDIDDSIISGLSRSTFSSDQKKVAASVLSNSNGYNVKALNASEIGRIRDYVNLIPGRIIQTLNLCQSDFSTFVPEKHEYIFALQSLMYAAEAVKEDKKKFLTLIAKYLSGLKDNGTLIIDEELYEKMKYHIKAMPSRANLLEEKSLTWLYRETPFETTLLPILSTTREDDAPRGRLPSVYFHRVDGSPGNLTTVDIYLLKRLPAKKQ